MTEIREYILEHFNPEEFNDILHIVDKYKITKNSIKLYSGTVPGDGLLVTVPKTDIKEYLKKEHNTSKEIRHCIPEEIKKKIIKDI